MGSRGLIGRTAERDALAALLDRASSGTGFGVVIEGEPGIGKTALLAVLLEEAGAQGFVVRQAVADELGQARPFGAVADALDLDRNALDAGDDAVARTRTVDEIVDRIESDAARAPVVLAVDDAHHADPSSIFALRALVRGAGSMRLAVVIARRPFPAGADLEGLAQDIVDGGGDHVRLGPLADADALALAERVVGTPADEPVRAAIARAGGNPLFIQELLLALREEGPVASAAQIPVSLGLAILRRIASLPPATVELLRVASVLGASFAPSDLAAVTDRRPSELLTDLGPAIASGMLAEHDGALAFRHELVREAVYGDLGAVRRAMHLQAAHALAAAGAPSDRVAMQYALGAEPGDEQAVAHLRMVAAEVGARAPAIAVRLLHRALELAPVSRRADLVADLVRWLTWAGDIDDARRLAASSLALVDGEAEVRLTIAFAKALAIGGRPAESLARLQAVGTVDPAVRAEISAEIGLRRCHLLDISGMRSAADEVRSAADAPPAVLASAWVAAGYASAVEGDVGRAVEEMRTAVGVARADPSEVGQLDGPLGYLGSVLVEADRLDEAAAALAEARADIERRGMQWNVSARLGASSLLHFQIGAWDEAVDDAGASLDLAEETQVRATSLIPSAVLARVAMHRGDLRHAAAILARADREITASGPGRIGIVGVLVAHGEMLEANGRVDAARQALLGTLWLCAHLGAGGAARDALFPAIRLAAGDHALLEEIGAHAEHLADRSRLPAIRAAVALTRALVRGNVVAAGRAASDVVPRPLEAALALEAAAALAVSLGDPSASTALGDRAIAGYERLQAPAAVARIERMLRAAGIRRGARGPRARPSAGWESLTPSERRVVDLVAEGLTNRAIAERLFVSRATVATHLSHVFTKLGVSSRAELAARVALGHDGGHDRGDGS